MMSVLWDHWLFFVTLWVVCGFIQAMMDSKNEWRGPDLPYEDWKKLYGEDKR